MIEKVLQTTSDKSDIFKSRCDSINRKNIALQIKLKSILSSISFQKELREIDRVCLASECADYFDKLYSIMNYATSVMSEILSERGNSYGDNFHDLVKKMLKNPAIFSESTKAIVTSVFSWYPIVHDMRSEEAHFSMGIVAYENEKYFYSINRHTLRKNMHDLLKEHNWSDAEHVTVYKIPIEDLKKIHIQYGTTMSHLAVVVNRYCKGT